MHVHIYTVTCLGLGPHLPAPCSAGTAAIATACWDQDRPPLPIALKMLVQPLQNTQTQLLQHNPTATCHCTLHTSQYEVDHTTDSLKDQLIHSHQACLVTAFIAATPQSVSFD